MPLTVRRDCVGAKRKVTPYYLTIQRTCQLVDIGLSSGPTCVLRTKHVNVPLLDGLSRRVGDPTSSAKYRVAWPLLLICERRCEQFGHSDWTST